MILHSCPVFVFFYFLNAKCWRAWLRRPAKILTDKDCCQRLLQKIVAKSASRDQKYASSANIKQFHFWKLQKNLTWQQIIFSYQKLHYTIHLHNLQRNASFMCWFKCLKWPKCNIFWERLPTLYSDHQGPYIVGLQARGLAPIFRSDLRLGPYISTATVHRFLLLK